MGRIFKSGAFIQQCFAIHPLSLSLQTVQAPRALVIICVSCKLTHRLLIRAVGASHADPEPIEGEDNGGSAAMDQFMQCASVHPSAVGVRAMDILKDSLGLRCTECRRAYDLDIAAFETHQP